MRSAHEVSGATGRLRPYEALSFDKAAVLPPEVVPHFCCGCGWCVGTIADWVRSAPEDD